MDLYLFRLLAGFGAPSEFRTRTRRDKMGLKEEKNEESQIFEELDVLSGEGQKTSSVV